MDRNRGFDIGSLRQQMEDLLEDFLGPGTRKQPPSGRAAGGEQPQHLAVNVIDQDERIIVSTALPGLSPEDIDITVRGQSLSIRAQQKTPPAERPIYQRREWNTGPYQRTLELPSAVEADQAEASFRNGVVTITLPKTDANKTRVIRLEDEGQEQAAETQPDLPGPTGDVAVEVEVTEPVPAAEVSPTPEAPTEAAGEAPEGTEPGTEQPTSFYMRPPRGRGRQPRSSRGKPARAKEPKEGEPATGAEGEGNTPEPAPNVLTEPHDSSDLP